SQESKCKAGASLPDRLALCHSPSYSGIRSSFAKSAAVINQSLLWFVLDLESLCKLKKNLIYTNHSTLSGNLSFRLSSGIAMIYTPRCF
ncbi:MAG: hypothetical protein UDM29_04735, partial [Dialister sp.]|nr:hypothetical protein [Dialister sp.]